MEKREPFPAVRSSPVRTDDNPCQWGLDPVEIRRLSCGRECGVNLGVADRKDTLRYALLIPSRSTTVQRTGHPTPIPCIYLCFRFAFSLGLRLPFFPASSRFASFASWASPRFAFAKSSRHRAGSKFLLSMMTKSSADKCA